MGKKGDFFFLSILVFISLTFIPLISGATSFYVEQAKNYSITFTCEIDGAVCSNSALCNISISYTPNSTNIVDNVATTNLLNSRFEYNLSAVNNAVKGEYKSTVVCYDGIGNGTDSFYYEVNPTGIRSTEQRTDTIRTSIYFLFFIGLLIFVAFLFTKQSIPVKWTLFGFSMIFFLATLNILFVTLQDEIVNPRLEGFFEGFTVIYWVLMRFIIILMGIMWMFTFIQTWLLKKNVAKLQKFGGKFE